MEGFLWGSLAASTLLIGALISIKWQIPKKMVGLIMAFGVGVLISAISFELVHEAFTRESGIGWGLVLGFLAGIIVFFVGNQFIKKAGGSRRKRLVTSKDNDGSAPGIVLGSVLDGIPESIVIGLSVASGSGGGIAMMIAVLLSNLPESIGSSSGLIHNGWSRIKVVGLWCGVIAISGIASLIGYLFFKDASSDVVALVLSFSAGALLTMISDTMMPEAFEDAGTWSGVFVALGFGVAFCVSFF